MQLANAHVCEESKSAIGGWVFDLLSALNKGFIAEMVSRHLFYMAKEWKKERRPMSTIVKPAMRSILLLSGLAFVLYGVFRGEAGMVLSKAAKICLECVGIG